MTDTGPKKVEKLSFVDTLLFAVAVEGPYSLGAAVLRNMSKQDSDTDDDDDEHFTPAPATKRDEPHIIEHWASALSFWVMLVYPTAAIVSYYGLSVAHILITHVDLTVVATGLVLGVIVLVVVWIIVIMLNPIFTNGAEIAKAVRESIDFKNEAGILDKIKAYFRYKNKTQARDSIQQCNVDKIDIK